MSLLSAVARAGPSSQISVHSVQRTLLPSIVPTLNLVDAKRHKTDKAGQQKRPPTGTPSQAGYLKREEKSNRWRKALLQFRPLPANQLDHPLFNPETEGKLEVPAFTPKTITAADSIGQAYEIEPPADDPLRIFGLPRSVHFEFRILTKPYTVVRQVTKDTVEYLSRAKKQSSAQNRLVMTGRAGCGKSFLMLQAVEHCVRDEWIVIYIPRAINLVNSTTPYAYDIRTQTYLQPAYSFQTLQRMLTVNKAKLAEIPLVEDLVLEKQTLTKGTKLTKVIEFAIAERARTVGQSPAILDAVMRSLDVQTDFPVLLAVDEIQALYGKSSYKDPHFLPIQPYHLSLPRLILEYASGKRQFSRGAVLGALSVSQTLHPVPLELSDALGLEDMHAFPISPFQKRNKEMLLYTEGLKKLAVPEKLTLEEATGVFEVWKGRKAIGREGMYYDEMLLGKYTESAGNARDFVWKGLLNTLEA
ncbi:hypothetical protein D9613_006518 [Agrocybe pediades]|uniref:Small ribosomal subunit protein mS29 n=1 Tax=Agrocybe pediades TaxID=84607 RepID=A0A8H4QGT6_9AGAR|nr:hypothetical protein D9613_006518 [Agrocybe pediades]